MRSSAHDLFFEPFQGRAQRRVGFQRLRHLLAGMHDGGVIFAPELATNFREGGIGQFTAEKHRDLAWMHQSLTSSSRLQVGDFQVEPRAHRLLDVVHGDNLFYRQ